MVNGHTMNHHHHRLHLLLLVQLVFVGVFSAVLDQFGTAKIPLEQAPQAPGRLPSADVQLHPGAGPVQGQLNAELEHRPGLKPRHF